MLLKAAPAGILNGLFSASASQQVCFSQGNLQATTTDLGKTWTWSFATNQYDFVGKAAANNKINGNSKVSENGTVDLFGWSTANNVYGITSAGALQAYYGAFIDWGNNAIANGGDTPNSGWRTARRSPTAGLLCALWRICASPPTTWTWTRSTSS